MVSKCFSLSIVQRKRKASSVTQPNSSKADQKVAEKVHYSSGSASVKLEENVAYDGAMYKYHGEAVYNVPT